MGKLKILKFAGFFDDRGGVDVGRVLEAGAETPGTADEMAALGRDRLAGACALAGPRSLWVSVCPCAVASRRLAHHQKKTRRIYRELGLQLRNKTPKRRVKAKLRDDRRKATRPNETWAMDFVHDQLATGQKQRVLTIVDTFSRFSPALEPRFSFRGTDVVEVLERVGRTIGLPATIRVDQGTEFVSRDLDLWAYQRGATLDFSRPGKPTDNAYIEAFNGRFRAECLNAHWFLNLADAREKWRIT